MKIRTVLLSAILLTSCGKVDQVQTLQGAAQGSTWQVSVWQPGGVDTHALQGTIDAEFLRLDKELSNYRPDSTIEHFNASDLTAPIAVGSEIVLLVQTAHRVSQASDGCYDLTSQPLFELWGFKANTLSMPDDKALTASLAQLGYTKLEALPPDLLRKSIPALRVDLSSIAQGYSVGRIAALVEAAGIQNYLVEVGGELQARGYKPNGSLWRIGVERPLPGGRSVQKALMVGGDAPLSVMTSGTYRHLANATATSWMPSPADPSLTTQSPSPCCIKTPRWRTPGPRPCSVWAKIPEKPWQTSKV